MTLLVMALALPGCAGTKTAKTAPVQTTDVAALDRLADPDFLFTGKGKQPGNTLRVKAMAYTACSVGKKRAKRAPRGAWGDPLTEDANAVAISPDLLEMGLDRGDLITIEGLPGKYKVLDVMHSRHDKSIDIFYGDDQCGALQWGKRTLTITWQ
jgi:3D (Asp-Asp-Asp) domain-containing protein